jgi:type VI secretion system secreted protein VgrG
VDFIAGDPERPIITGRVYNADTGPTNLPFPEPSVEKTVLKNRGDNSVKDAKELPETQKSNPLLSGIKTQSIPTTGKQADGSPLKPRFHLLRFYDKRNHEQYLIRSQHRLDITAFAKRFESIGSDRHLTVGGKDLDSEPPQIAGDYIAHVFRDYHLHVGDPDFYQQSGNRYTLIENNDQLKVMGDAEQSVNGDWSTFASGKATLITSALGGKIVLWAGGNITLTVGASSIVITPAGISISAPTINLVAPTILSTVPVVPEGAVSLPPELPHSPAPQPPKDPTPADPGDKLTPPE